MRHSFPRTLSASAAALAPCGAAAPGHSFAVPAAAHRRGLSLLEVLISIFVLAVGLLSVASLIPVASLQAERSIANDRKVVTGMSAIHEIKIRGFLRPDLWQDQNAVAFCQASGAFPASKKIGQTSAAKVFTPVALDPLMIAEWKKQGLTGTIPNFATTAQMTRYTCATAVGPAAEQICISQDDLEFSQPANADSPPIGGYFGPTDTTGKITPIKRSSAGRYSWMVTLVPAYGDVIAAPVRDLVIMSVVVFKDRSLTGNPVKQVYDTASSTVIAPAPERSATVKFNSNTTLAGGDITLVDTGTAAGTIKPSAMNLNVNPGEWLLLALQINDSTAGTGASRSWMRWYRVVTAAPAFQDSSGIWNRNVTIAGPDLNLNMLVASTSTPPTAYLFDGAVAVYERPVHLEGPSIWTTPPVQNSLY